MIKLECLCCGKVFKAFELNHATVCPACGNTYVKDFYQEEDWK